MIVANISVFVPLTLRLSLNDAASHVDPGADGDNEQNSRKLRYRDADVRSHARDAFVSR